MQQKYQRFTNSQMHKNKTKKNILKYIHPTPHQGKVQAMKQKNCPLPTKNKWSKYACSLF